MGRWLLWCRLGRGEDATDGLETVFIADTGVLENETGATTLLAGLEEVDVFLEVVVSSRLPLRRV